MKRRWSRPGLSIEHLWPLATLFVIWFFLSTHPVRPNDFWWHLRAGEQIVTTGRIPNVDTFSFTMAGRPYDNYASFWVVESAYYLLYSLGGLPLLIFSHSLTVATAYGLVLWLCWQSSGSWRVAAAGTFYAAVLGVNDWNLRPQGVALLLGALFLWAIYEYRRRARAWLLAIFPLAMLAWANSHGSFVVGFLLLAIWLVDETWHAIRDCMGDSNRSETRVVEEEVAPTVIASSPPRRRGGMRPDTELPRVIASGSNPSAAQPRPTGDAISSTRGTRQPRLNLRCLPARRLVVPALALAASALVCLANPRGVGIIGYVRSLASNPVVRDLVPEWAPPSFGSTPGAILLIGLLLTAALLAVSPRRPSLFQMLSFLCFGVLALQGVRFGVWFGMVLAPVAAEHLAATVYRARTAWSSLAKSRRLGRAGVGSAGESARGEVGARGSRPHRRTFVALNWLAAGMLLFGAVLATPWLKHTLPLPPIRAGLASAETPVEATRFLLQQRMPGRLFHELGFGSYLIWVAPGDYPVFVDPRIELYPAEVWSDYREISAAGEGWERKLEEYGVNTLMLSPGEQPSLVEAVGRSQNWRLAYRDPEAVLYVRIPRPG
jgi:hypothetical protein